MSGSKDLTSVLSGNDETHESEPESHFRRRSLNRKRWWNIPRRYVLAIMCYLAFFITAWMLTNTFATLSHFFFVEDHLEIFPVLRNMTFEDINKMDSSYAWGSVFAQIPGALLVIKYTGHRILGICVAVASVLHMLTPLSLYYHILGTMTVVCLQGVAAGPMVVACVSIWREWAPPSERTRLMALALGGMFLSPIVSIYLCTKLIEQVSPVASYVVPGISGLTWSFAWYTLTSDSPINDPLITETELLFLEEKIPAVNKLKIELKKIPIKSILTSRPALSLCIVYFAEGCVLVTMMYGSFMFYMMLEADEHDPSYVIIFYIGSTAIIPLMGYLADFLIIKSNGKVTIVRKCFFCTAAAIHSVFVFAAFTSDWIASITCFVASYFAATLSIPGYISNALDLSPHYAPVLAAISMLFSKISSVIFDCVAEYIITEAESFEAWKLVLIPGGLLSVFAVVLYAIFGSGEEQPWSSSSIPHSSVQRNRNDSLCYPTDNDIDENYLVTDAL